MGGGGHILKSFRKSVPFGSGEVVGSNPGCAIPKALKMVPVATLLGAQHYKASTGSPLTHY